MYYKWRGFLLAFLFPIIVSANTDGPVKLGGRLFIDGGLFTKNSYSAHAKAEITDVRLTGKITLPDEWYTKIDVGFAGNKVSLKDAFVQKKWGNNNFRIGYMLGMCCIEQSASTNDYVFMTGANAAETFYLGRRVGVSYTFSQKNYGSRSKKGEIPRFELSHNALNRKPQK